jgi:hypothetical protein
MNFYESYADIAPHEDEVTGATEPFESWFARVQGRIPHVPRSVAEDWLHRHWGQSFCSWIDLGRLRFRLERWESARLSDIKFDEMTWGNHDLWLKDLIKSQHWASSRELWVYMEQHGTWPVPIIVLKSPPGTDDPRFKGWKLPSLLLLEGHHRLEFIRALVAVRKARPEHEIWLAELE